MSPATRASTCARSTASKSTERHPADPLLPHAGQFWVTKHAPLAFSVAKGYSLACDALRNSLLLVGAVHLRYLSQTQSDPTGVTRLRAKTVGMIKQVIDTGDTAEDELLLSALLSCAVSCVRAPPLWTGSASTI